MCSSFLKNPLFQSILILFAFILLAKIADIIFTRILKRLAAKTKTLFDDHNMMNMIKEYSNWPTTPQLYVDGELIGGCDIVEELTTTGELEKILTKV